MNSRFPNDGPRGPVAVSSRSRLGAIALCPCECPHLTMEYVLLCFDPTVLRNLARQLAATRRRNGVAGPQEAAGLHPRSAEERQQRVRGKVNMLQHQAGMAARVDRQRFHTLIDEEAVRAREHSQALEAAVPGLRSSSVWARIGQLLDERGHELQRALLQARRGADRQQRQTNVASADTALHDPGCARARRASTRALNDRAMFSAGKLPTSGPGCRQIVECTRGLLLLHEGGVVNRDGTSATAHWVTLQTGRMRHDASRRVRSTCGPTGRRCLFVAAPSSTGLEPALREVWTALQPLKPDG